MNQHEQVMEALALVSSASRLLALQTQTIKDQHDLIVSLRTKVTELQQQVAYWNKYRENW